MWFCLTPDGLHFGKEEGVPAVRVGDLPQGSGEAALSIPPLLFWVSPSKNCELILL